MYIYFPPGEHYHSEKKHKRYLINNTNIGEILNISSRNSELLNIR